MQKLPRTFYERDTCEVAQALLGKYLIHDLEANKRIGKIVEVEAYLGPHDLAAHSSKGITQRTQVMYGEAGHAYVYLIYGLHYCTNVVTEPAGHGSAVLLRALEPISNLSGRTQGPGLLSKAMGINKCLNGWDLLSDNFYIASGEEQNINIITRPRIGVDYAKEWAQALLRFYIKDNPYVSKR